jgi:hypothetical protein
LIFNNLKSLKILKKNIYLGFYRCEVKPVLISYHSAVSTFYIFFFTVGAPTRGTIDVCNFFKKMLRDFYI